MDAKKSSDKKGTPSQNKMFNWIMIAVIVLLVGFLGFTYKSQIAGVFQGSSDDSYKAVFLTNGQVYFGKVDSKTGSYLTLKEVFYLQVQQPLQPQNPDSAEQPKPELKLVKLGSELHGPEDYMKINSDHILFVESLKGDSQVVTGIADYYKN